jgi:hypothetical protein
VTTCDGFWCSDDSRCHFGVASCEASLGLHFLDTDFYFLANRCVNLCFGIGQNVSGEQKDGIFLDDDFYFCTAIV